MEHDSWWPAARKPRLFSQETKQFSNKPGFSRETWFVLWHPNPMLASMTARPRPPRTSTNWIAGQDTRPGKSQKPGFSAGRAVHCRAAAEPGARTAQEQAPGRRYRATRPAGAHQGLYKARPPGSVKSRRSLAHSVAMQPRQPDDCAGAAPPQDLRADSHPTAPSGTRRSRPPRQGSGPDCPAPRC